MLTQLAFENDYKRAMQGWKEDKTLIPERAVMDIVLLKIILLISLSYLLYLSASAPQPPATKEDKVHKSGVFERAVRTWIFFLRAALSGVPLLHAVTLVAFKAGDRAGPAFQMLCPRPSSADGIEAITPVFIIAWILCSSAIFVRLWCYKVLDRFFTFELALRPNHSLVTSGPYAFVRHPSYSSGIASIVASISMAHVNGGYIKECGILQTPLRVLDYSWIAFISFCVYYSLKRVSKEDTLLRNAFKEEWERWKSRVPYKLVPGLY